MSTLSDGVVATKDLDLKIEVVDDYLNLADEEEIAEAVLAKVSGLASEYEGQLEDLWDELAHFDYMFRCGRNATERASNEAMKTPRESEANCGATMFFRQIVQSAAKIYALATSRDAYWKYIPLETIGIEYSKQESEEQANMMNTLIKWNLQKDKFASKLPKFAQSVSKYGLLYVTVDWMRSVSTRTIKSPPKEGQEENQSIDLEVINENRATINTHSPFSVLLDPLIEDIQKQECVLVSRVVGMPEIIEMVELGYYSEEQFRKITSDQQWDGSAGRFRSEETAENREIEIAANTKGANVLLWDAWVLLPISEDGDMDEMKNKPLRYRCSFVGNTIENSICLRVERNDHPEDRIPMHLIWDYSDDSGDIAHISKGHVLKNNYAVETTALNQMIDGVSLALDPPNIERKGGVINYEGYGRGKRIVVRDSVTEDIREFPVADRTQTGIALLEYAKNDSKTAIHTDNAQMGEGLGSRASASEASGVMQLSAAPSVMNAKYVLDQLFYYLAIEMKVYWQNYSMDKQVVQITDSTAPIQTVKPSNIYGDFDVVVDIVDRVVNDILGEQKIAQDISMLTQNPALSERIQVDELLNEYFIIRYGKTFTKNYDDADAKAMAMNNVKRIMAGDTAVQPEEGQNLKVHLRIYKAERLRYKGVEDEFAGQVTALDRLIEQYEQESANKEASAQTGGGAQQPSVAGAPEAAAGGGMNMMANAGAA